MPTKRFYQETNGETGAAGRPSEELLSALLNETAPLDASVVCVEADFDMAEAILSALAARAPQVRRLELTFDGSPDLSFPRTIERLASLQELKVEFRSLEMVLEELLSSLASLPCLRVLDLSESSFDDVPDAIAGLRLLEKLDVSRNDRLRRISPRISELRCLRELSVKKCHEFHDSDALRRALPWVEIDD